MSTMVLPMIHIVKKGTVSAEEIELLRAKFGQIEVLSEEEYEGRVDQANREFFEPYRLELKKLSFNEKQEWYANRNSQEIVYLGNNPYFQRYWKWRVLIPIKVKRFFYRLKNGELFKRYEHISEMKKKNKTKLYSI